jgi:ribosomal protein S18 acetylase RimI-like enzyme
MNTTTAPTGLPGDKAVPGLRFRAMRGTADIPGMAAANQRARDAAGIAELVSAEGMARDYAHLVNCDLDRDVLVVERDGAIVGYGRVEWRDLENGGRTFTCLTLLQPDAVSPAAYDAMVAWAEARQAAKASAIPADQARPGALRTFTFGTDVVLGEVLTARGWTRTGQGYEMVRPTLDDIPEPPMPDGIVVRPIGTDVPSRRRVWDAATEAFADERDEAEPTEEDWLADLANPHVDPALWIVGFDGDEVAGAAQGRIDPVENAHHGWDRGYIEAVFTRRAWRRRGLARALLARALVRLRDHGMTSAYLGVDGLNPNQAMDLYTNLGFEVASTSHDWTKPLPELPTETT